MSGSPVVERMTKGQLMSLCVCVCVCVCVCACARV